MVDNIFKMLLKEARSREGPDFIVKLNDVIIELDGMIIDYMIYHEEHPYPPFHNEEEEAKAHSAKYDRWAEKFNKAKARRPV